METYETKDQYLAALLLCFPDAGFQLFRSSRSDKGFKEAWYIFNEKDICNEIIKAYFVDTLSLNPRIYVESLTKIREMYKSV